MHACRLFAAAVIAAVAVGCGRQTEGPHGETGGGPPSENGSQATNTHHTGVRQPEPKRAVAGKEACTVGPITCEILSWKVEKPELANGKRLDTEYLTVRVKFSTTDDTVSKNVELWLIEAKDNFGNKVDRHNHAARDFAGVQQKGAIRAKQPVNILITLIPPVAKASHVDIDIPAEDVGLTQGEWFRFRVPLK